MPLPGSWAYEREPFGGESRASAFQSEASREIRRAKGALQDDSFKKAGVCKTELRARISRRRSFFKR